MKKTYPLLSPKKFNQSSRKPWGLFVCMLSFHSIHAGLAAVWAEAWPKAQSSHSLGTIKFWWQMCRWEVRQWNSTSLGLSPSGHRCESVDPEAGLPQRDGTGPPGCAWDIRHLGQSFVFTSVSLVTVPDVWVLKCFSSNSMEESYTHQQHFQWFI